MAANLLGQNTPAIAAAEAEYEQMWAQDVAAMAGYHAEASAVAAQLALSEGLQQRLQNLQARRRLCRHGFRLSIDLTTGTFNLGTGNNGVNNIGFGNIGNGNIGVGNLGDGNIGVREQAATGTSDSGNTGNGLIGFGLPGDGNIGVNGHRR